MNITVDYAALSYLNHWFGRERKICHALQGNDVKAKLDALNEGAAVFRIARNLQRKYDVGLGLPRLGPVFEAIDTLTSDDFEADTVQSVLGIRDQLSAVYGNRDVLSATTKFLWLKVKSPIIIYDSQAKTAIGTPSGDLAAFYDSWLTKFSDHEAEIGDACSRLSSVLSYSIDPTLATKEYVERLAQASWFRQRVFDIYLWHVGNNQ